MVVGHDGAQLGVMELEEALNVAAESEMDLVEVASNVNPPVCKVMDYGKFKYRQSKKAHDAKKKQKVIKVKEVKITPNTEEHDIQFKLAHARRFLADEAKVKVSVFFKGRQITHSELGLKILKRFVKELVEFAEVEEQPKTEGKRMFLILAPKVVNPVVTKKAKPSSEDTKVDNGENNAEA
ncbi:Translation initiation factor 3 [hydrothermal vent metagenome]|uniref:Translation initiation factor 3 n=1 Tax=hydrothermal vent metagenome TaxID=652676 RepID=A0A3B1C846_9ZZZZ